MTLTRRDFVATTLAAGFALAAQPICANTTIQTPADGLRSGEAMVPSGTDHLPVYFARPAGNAAVPVVLVVQEIFGLHEHIRDVCRRLAQQGYLAIAPELYARQGDVSKLPDVATIISTVVSKVADSQVLADLDACVRWANTQQGDTKRLAITGFCWGGRITWLYAAHQPQVKAAVAWYGRLVEKPSEMNPKHPIDLVAELKAPVLGLYGGADTGIPLTAVDAMRQALQAAKQPSEIVVYPDAPHAFHADYRPSYRAEAAEDGWKRMLDWFRKHGVA